MEAEAEAEAVKTKSMEAEAEAEAVKAKSMEAEAEAEALKPTASTASTVLHSLLIYFHRRLRFFHFLGIVCPRFTNFWLGLFQFGLFQLKFS